MTCGPLKYTKPLVMLPKPQTVENAIKARVCHEIFVACSFFDMRMFLSFFPILAMTLCDHGQSAGKRAF